MTKSRALRRTVLPAVVALVATAAIVGLREATMSRHTPSPPDSRTDVVVRASTHKADSGASRTELTEAMIAVCRLQVHAEPVGIMHRVDDRVYAFSLRPALDDSDRRQLAGCLQDARVDHVLLNVLAMTNHPSGAPSDRE